MDEKYKLKKLISKLEKIKGRHTELVSVYVPAGQNLDSVKNQVSSEAETASNIKSKTVRKNVQTALEKMIAELKKYKKTPENGMVLFSGNVSDTEGKSDFQLWAIHPPEKLNIRLYRCDSEFILEHLKEMLEAKHAYGLVVMDHRHSTIALLKGKNVNIVHDMESQVMGKFKAGGQSSRRFQREREEQIKHFFKKIGDICVKFFDEVKTLKGIIVGGPGPAKEDFKNGPFLPNRYRDKIIAVKDISSTGEHGIKELVVKSEDVLEQEEIIEEKKAVDEFLRHLAKDTGLASYGEAEIKKNLKNGSVEKLLLSESLEEEKIEEFSELAENFGTEVILISEETQEGVQLRELGGFAAILRYKLN